MQKPPGGASGRNPRGPDSGKKFKCIVKDCDNDSQFRWFWCDWHRAQADKKIAELDRRAHDPQVRTRPYELSCVECGHMVWRWWTDAELKIVALAVLTCGRCNSHMIEVARTNAF